MPIREWMTPQQRVLAAIKLEPYDRVPVAPLVDFSFAVRRKGLTLAQGFADYRGVAWPAIVDLFKEAGGWDGFILPGWSQTPNPNHPPTSRGSNVKIPGRKLPEDSLPQFVETEAMTTRDYDDIIKSGWNRWCEKTQRENPQFSAEKYKTWAEEQISQFRLEAQTWAQKDIPVMAGAITSPPFMTLSTIRSMKSFATDIQLYPDKVRAVMDTMVEDLISNALEVTKLTGIPGVALITERSGASYFPLTTFERFALPYIKKMVDAFAARDIITILHLDNDWILNLPYLRELPARMCVCELDDRTNIFEAREILKNHMCVAGNVPGTLLSQGTTVETESYCKKLIEKIGKDTGFILSTGCVLPADCKPENFKIMVRTARDYYPYARKPIKKIF